jgi:hypothetical protein
MTSAMPAVPSGLPEDLYHSAPMVLVRYPGETAFASARIRRRLTLKAIMLASVCAALAFFFSALRERKQAPAAPAALAPVAAKREIAGAGPIPTPAPRHFALPERPDRKITEFILAASPEFQSLGPVKLKLAGVDARRGSYNLSVRMRGRQFTRTNVKVDQAVKLGNGKKAAPEIVVGAIVQNRVWGYLSEPKSKVQSSHRRRRRRL